MSGPSGIIQTELATLELTIRQVAQPSSMCYHCCVSLNLFEAGDAVAVQLTKDAIAHFDQEKLKEQMPDASAYAALLTTMLFSDPVMRSGWDMAWQQIEQRSVHLRLCIDGSPALHDFLWELLCDPRASQPIYLAASQRALFSRYIEQEIKSVVPEDLAPHMLVAVANPDDLEKYTLTVIDRKTELQLLEGNYLSQVPRSLLGEPTNPANLMRSLVNDQATILYLLCHGQQVNGKSYLFLESSDGKTERVSDDEFIAMIKGLSWKPQLIVLAACEGAGAAVDGLFSSLGPGLIQAGIPAVIAMRGKIARQSVTALMPPFFDSLVEDGRVDLALSVARGYLNPADWWQIVLFTGVPNSRLWRNLLKQTVPQCTKRPQANQLYGQDAVQKAIIQALKKPTTETAVTVSGVPGSGKTDLLRSVGQNLFVRAHFFDGVLYSELGPRPVLENVLKGWLKLLRVKNYEDSLEAFTNALSNRVILVIIDDVWDGESRSIALKLMEAVSGRNRLLFSTRSYEMAQKLPKRSAHFILQPLDEHDALELLDQCISIEFGQEGFNHQAVNCVAREPRSTRLLLQAIEYLPLAIRLVARLIFLHKDENYPVATFLRSWTEYIEVVDGDQERPELVPGSITLDAIINRSFEALGDNSVRNAVAALGVFGAEPNSWTSEAMEDIWNSSRVLMTQWKSSLLRSGLINYDLKTSHFTMHSTIGAFLQSRVPHEPRKRHAEYYLKIIKDGGNASIDAVYPNPRLALEWATQSGNAAMALQFGALLWRYWESAGLFGEGKKLLQHILDISPSENLVDRKDYFEVLTGAGSLTRSEGDMQEAHTYFKAAWDVAMRTEDILLRARANNNLGESFSMLGDYDNARDSMQESLALFYKLEDDYRIAVVMGNLGKVDLDTKAYEPALEHFTTALALFDPKHNIEDFINYRVYKGITLSYLGRVDEARKLIVTSVAEARDQQYPWGEAIAYDHLGWLELEDGRLEETAAAFINSLRKLNEVYSFQGLQSCFEGLGGVMLYSTLPQCAAYLYGVAARLREKTGEPLPSDEEQKQRGRIAQLRTQLSDEEFTSYWEKGRVAELEPLIHQLLQVTLTRDPATNQETIAAIDICKRLHLD
ncbi:MAG: CHAT domain-containing protein [Oscillochloris sp.]|nr:CHAT domain-containing protein [Oscillochloris sp.]